METVRSVSNLTRFSVGSALATAVEQMCMRESVANRIANFGKTTSVHDFYDVGAIKKPASSIRWLSLLGIERRRGSMVRSSPVAG